MNKASGRNAFERQYQLGNTHGYHIEDSVSPVKRNLYGTFYQVSEKHLLAKNKELNLPVIQPRTVEKHLDRLRRFFNWADDRSYLTIKNPFSNRRLMAKDKRGTKKKVPFDDADLGDLPDFYM